MTHPTENETPAAAEPVANILLVDDREDKSLAMETIIADLGQNVVKAASGREALRCLMNQSFAVILLDVNMPGMDGFETAHLIRQRRSLEHVPIIFVTGISDTDNHVSRGYSLGAVDYILTPVVPEILRAKVSVFVELFKATEQIKRQAEHLRAAHDDLELRVRQRTQELAVANDSLQGEMKEREGAQAKLRLLNIELEQRVSARTTELQTANRELETFTYSIAHDLRAPLRQIHGYVQILQDDFPAQIPAPAQEFLGRIGQRASVMGQMVDDLLRLSGVAKQELRHEPTDLNAVVHEVIDGLAPETKDRRIEWDLAPLPVIACSSGLMKQALTNLLSNAVKYTRPRETAHIRLGAAERDGELVLSVQDNGVGFSMVYADRLFGVFQRLHRADEFEGTGIGLALVSRIIQKHGGRVWAEAEPGQGATFYLALPQNKTSRPE